VQNSGGRPPCPCNPRRSATAHRQLSLESSHRHLRHHHAMLLHEPTMMDSRRRVPLRGRCGPILLKPGVDQPPANPTPSALSPRTHRPHEVPDLQHSAGIRDLTSTHTVRQRWQYEMATRRAGEFPADARKDR
jgi:hypothetical protein